MKNKALKIILSCVLLAYLAGKIDLNAFLRLFTAIKLFDLLALFILFSLLYTIVGSLRWQIILSAQGVRVPPFKAMRIYSEALFFAMFTPGGLGGDVYKIKKIRELTNTTSTAAASVVFDRYVGFVTLLLIGAVAALSLPRKMVWTIPVAILYLAVFTASIIPYALLLLRKGQPIPQGSGFFQIWRERLDHFSVSLRLAIHSKRRIALVLLVSLIYQAGIFIIVSRTAHLLGSGVGLHGFLAFSPMVFIAAMLPISLNGLGVREASFAFFLSSMGDSIEVGVGLSLVIFLLAVFNSLIGAWLYFTRK